MSCFCQGEHGQPYCEVCLPPQEEHVKTYAKGCDALGCKNESEVDKNLGRPVGWYFVTMDGGTLRSTKTVVLCDECYRATTGGWRL